MKPARSYFLHLIFCISLLLVFSSCYKEKFDNLKLADAHPEYLSPLIDAELNLKNIVDPNKKKLNITENSEGFYTFIYYQDVFDKPITDYLIIGDQTVNQSVSLTTGEAASLPVSGSVTHNFTNNYTLASPNGERLKKMTVKSGYIPLNISSTFKHTVQLTITFPYIIKNGVALSKSVTIANNGAPFSEQIDLSGYTIDLTKGNAAIVNTISYNGSLKVTFVSGNPINTSQKVDITTGVAAIQYSYADGYIGKYVLEIPKDTLTIDIFNNAYSGNVFFNDPKVRAIIYNSIGVPATVKLNSLTAVSNMSGETPVTGSNINTDIAIQYPLSITDKGKNTLIQLDKTNSNVQTIFNPAPDKVAYEMTGFINKAANTSISNFVTDTSRIKVRGEVEIPMEGYVKKLVLLDTIKGMEYPDIVIGKDVTILKAGFIVNMDNGFPMDAILQMYFINEANEVVDSLFSKGPQLIPSAVIDADGKVTKNTHVLIKEMFEEDRYSRVTACANAVMYAFFRTANNGTVPIRIYPSYTIKSNIGIDIKANVSF